MEKITFSFKVPGSPTINGEVEVIEVDGMRRPPVVIDETSSDSSDAGIAVDLNNRKVREKMVALEKLFMEQANYDAEDFSATPEDRRKKRCCNIS